MSRPKVVVSICATLFLLSVIATAASGDIPRRLNYQGRLLSAAGEPLAGSHNLTFRIFADADGGTELWSESQAVAADSGGVITVVLGAVDSIGIAFDGPRWLEIEVDGEVLAPRREMVSVPFALQAVNSHLLECLHPDAFADSAHSHSSLEAADGDPAKAVYVDGSGKVGVGTQAPDADLDVAGTARVEGFALLAGAASGRVLTSDASGTGTWQAPQASPDGDWEISGNNMHSAVSGKVSIGTASPLGRFEVIDTSSAGNLIAIYGRAASATAPGSKGVVGETHSNEDQEYGVGVAGLSWGTEGSGVGVGASSHGPTGKAVEAIAWSNSGVNYGVYGRTLSPYGYAGYFEGGRNYFEGNVGIGTDSNPNSALAVANNALTPGSSAIRGYATTLEDKTIYGIRGDIFAPSATGNPGAGVYGSVFVSFGSHAGVLGKSSCSSGSGVIGEATNTTGVNYGIKASTVSPNGYAGYFIGGRNYFQGRVGFGTDSPQAHLHVHNTVSASTTLEMTNAGTGSASSDGLHLEVADDGNASLVNMENKALDLGTNGAPRLSIHPDGQVGIGTRDTLGSVTIAAPGPALALNATSDAPFVGAKIVFHDNGTYKCGIHWGTVADDMVIGHTNHPGVVITAPIGYVGIGRRSPQNLLQVKGAGSTAGGVNGYTEVVGHFTTTGSGHTAVSIDAEANLDPILYLAENGNAYWDLRSDSDLGKRFELRYHGLGGKNNTVAVVDTTGNVGIGTTTPGGYKLYVAGTAYSTGGWTSSDARLKDKIAPIEGALSKSLALNGVSFEWRRDKFPEKGLPEGRHYGLIAQEVEKVLPEAVNWGPDEEKAVAYSEIIPVLVEALKAQQAEIEDLRAQVEKLQSQSEARH